MAAVATGERDWNQASDAHEAEMLRTIRAAQADPYAFEPLYREYVGLVQTYTRRRLGDAELAADVTSQVFINALRALPRYRPNSRQTTSSFRSWLFSIAHNVVIDAYLRHRPHQSLDAPAPDDERLRWDVRSAESGPEDLAIAAEESSALWRAVAQLPDWQRAVIELRLIGFDRREIAATLGFSEAAVRSAQFRGFVTLREVLDITRHTDSPKEHP